MNRNRLVIRIVLLVAVAVVFYIRRDRMSPDFAKGFVFALAFAVVIVVVRAVIESKKHKQVQQDQQAAAESKKVELFTKPKDQ